MVAPVRATTVSPLFADNFLAGTHVHSQLSLGLDTAVGELRPEMQAEGGQGTSPTTA